MVQHCIAAKFMRVPTSSSMLLIAFVIGVLPGGSFTEQGIYSINRPVVPPPPEAPRWKSRFLTGSVRCFCNLPACITTGYMCKSSSGGCFSDLSHQSSSTTVYRGLHGCLELLSNKEQKDLCQPRPNSNISHKKKNHPRSLLLCCYRDMCNHADSIEATKVFMDEAEIFFNDTSNNNFDTNSQIETLNYSSSEVWFKAATIAVPICGAVILLVLIVLAVRILRSETRPNSRHKLRPTYISAHSKNNCGKLQEHYHASKILMHKELIPVHQSPLYVNNVEELRQIRTPLLVQNELGNQHFQKNITSKYNNICYPYVINPTEYGAPHSNAEVNYKNINTDDRHNKMYDKSNKLKDNLTSQ